MSALTIVTPSHERREGLLALKASLAAQSCRDFDWLIVDDGSACDIAKLYAERLNDGSFPMRLLLCGENGGKHRALNRAFLLPAAPLTLIVDDDDTLLPEAVETILAVCTPGLSDDGLAGWGFQKLDTSGRPLCPNIPAAPRRAPYAKFRLAERRPGDMAEVWRSELLRARPFPEFAGEKFYSEEGEWLRLSAGRELLFCPQAVYRSEYRADGLTRGGHLHKLRSPLGMVDRAVRLTDPACGRRAQAKGTAQLIAYGLLGGLSWPQLWHRARCKTLLVLLAAPMALLSLLWRCELLRARRKGSGGSACGFLRS